MRRASQTAREHPVLFAAGLFLSWLMGWVVVGLMAFDGVHIVEAP